MITMMKHKADLFKLDLADELLGRDELSLDEFVFRLEVDDPPEIGNGQLGLQDLEITRRASSRHASQRTTRFATGRKQTGSMPLDI